MHPAQTERAMYHRHMLKRAMHHLQLLKVNSSHGL